MKLIGSISLRMIVLFLLWSLPAIFYVGVGLVAIHRLGWWHWIVWTLPPIWVSAWLIGRVWPPTKLKNTYEGKPLTAPSFWTPRDAAAIEIIEDFRSSVDDVNATTIGDVDRYLGDARKLAERLAKHYHADESDDLIHPLTFVELLAVIHLAAEDLEEWVLGNVPGADVATVGQIRMVPSVVNAIDIAQKVAYVASAILNPAKLAAYPLWRKSGRVTVELQNELIRKFYQRFLRQLGFYLIEMYSGRLQGGSKRYRDQFGTMTAAVQAAGGNAQVIDELQDMPTTIAVMGQVKAGKSSLINALIADNQATTSVLPETREVKRYQYKLPESSNSITLLDTPGYDEADVTKSQRKEIETAVIEADIVLLVLAANVTARQADKHLVEELKKIYAKKSELRPPTILAVVTHIDLLRPVREWTPPYDWRTPHSLKEESIAASVQYMQEIFGGSIAGYACVYTGDTHPQDSSVVDELVPLLVEHLDHGHAAAILKAFYKQLSKERFQKLSRQVLGLLKTILR